MSAATDRLRHLLFDLESPDDLARLQEPTLALGQARGLVVLAAVLIAGTSVFLFRALPSELAPIEDRSVLVGIGIATYAELTGIGSRISAAPGMPINTGTESSTIRIDSTGAVTALFGIASTGQGLETSLAQVVADELGAALGDIQIVQGDSAASAHGTGSYASRSAVLRDDSGLLRATRVGAPVISIGSPVGKSKVNESWDRESDRFKVAVELAEFFAPHNAELEQLSDFGTLRTLGAGVNWEPIPQLDFNFSYTDEDGAPSMQQLGDPVLLTPAVRVFDFVRGETVEIARLEGGNPDFEAGLSAKWGITPNITFSGTINPDFYQVEADAARARAEAERLDPEKGR